MPRQRGAPRPYFLRVASADVFYTDSARTLHDLRGGVGRRYGMQASTARTPWLVAILLLVAAIALSIDREPWCGDGGGDALDRWDEGCAVG